MNAYIIKRLVGVPIVLWGVSTFVFFMIHLVPGDPVELMFGYVAYTEEQLNTIRHNMGLDQPLIVQYSRFLFDAVQGDLGLSIRTQRPVMEEVLLRLPNTIKLAVTSMMVAIVLGLVGGIFSATNHGTWLDTLGTIVSTIGVSIPGFWLGLMLIMFFGVRLRWLPVFGADTLLHLIMPSLALGLYVAAIIARLTRSSLLNVLRSEYITTARAKGLPRWLILSRHALKNALISVVTFVGIQFGRLLGGAIVIEAVFAWPGIGNLAVQSLQSRDYPMVQGVVLVVSVMFIFSNLIVDLFYSVLDPRIRYD